MFYDDSRTNSYTVDDYVIYRAVKRERSLIRDDGGVYRVFERGSCEQDWDSGLFGVG